MQGNNLNQGINLIDPNKYSSEELLKLVYRATITIESKIDEIQRANADDKQKLDDRINVNKIEIAQLKTIILEKEKNFKNSISILTILFTAISLVSGLLSWILTKI
jgi:hypothetical protein